MALFKNGIWHNGHQQALYKSIYFFQNTVGMLVRFLQYLITSI